jgi:hypothetical protein
MGGGNIDPKQTKRTEENRGTLVALDSVVLQEDEGERNDGYE